jgi:AsmA-like C-terminal region/AsmA family
MEPDMASRGKSVLKKLLIVVLVLVAVLLVLPLFINVDRYRPEIVSEIERQTGRRAEMGGLSVRFLPKISVVVKNFALGNPPGFPTGNFVTAAKVSANLEIGPLLHRQLVVESVDVENPDITLLSKGEQWNYATPAANSVRNASYSIPLQTTVGEIVISGAHVTLAHVLSSGEVTPAALEATDVRIDLKPVNLGTLVAPASLSPARPDHGIPLRLISFDVGALPPTTRNQVTAQGSLTAKVVRYSQVNLTDLESNIALDPAQFALNPFSFKVFGGKGSGSFRMNLARADSPYQLSVNLAAVDVAKLLAAFPGGSGKMTGSLQANCQFSGDFAGQRDPWAGKQADGKVTIVRGRVPDLKLGRDVIDMMKVAGFGPTSGDITSFSSISADFALQGGVLSSRSIRLVGNGLNATAQGSANLEAEPNPTLNYTGVAQVKAAATALTNALSTLVRMPIHNGMVDLPFQVSGTLNTPKFHVQPPAGLLSPANTKNKPNSPDNVIQGLMGLFGKKRPTKQ